MPSLEQANQSSSGEMGANSRSRPEGTNSVEYFFQKSPNLIFIGAILLTVVPVVIALCAPRRIRYGRRGRSRSIQAGQSSLNESYEAYLEQEIDSKGVRLTRPHTLRDRICHPFRQFYQKLAKIPHRFFAFYVDAFYIPLYRKEWGKYRIWSFRAQERRHRLPMIKIEMKRLKREEIRRSREYHERCRESRGEDNTYFIPRPIPHNHFDCARVRINVNGCIFETQERTLRAFPNSLLGDPLKRIQYYDPASNSLFFDRSRTSFEAILHFFQTGGHFRKPESVNFDAFLDDAEFYGIPESIIEDFKREEGLEKEDGTNQANVPKNLYLRKLWLLFDNPHSSYSAKALAWLSLFVVMISIVTFIAETHVVFQDEETTTKMARVDGQMQTVSDDQNDLTDPFYFTETVSVIWFSLELVVRIITCPSKVAFFSSTLNIIDICSVLPYYITLITISFASAPGKGGAYWAIQAISILRLVRVLRIFKLSRHSEGLKILGRTLQASISELFLLVFFVLIGMVLFSSAMYLIEGSSNQGFSSIPSGFWWAMITMTTVGYGDDVPRSWLGKFVGSLCAIAGVFTIALPVPVIVSNFNYFYHQAIDEAHYKLAKINHVGNCPFRPGGSGDNATSVKMDRYIEPDSDSDFESLKFDLKPERR